MAQTCPACQSFDVVVERELITVPAIILQCQSCGFKFGIDRPPRAHAASPASRERLVATCRHCGALFTGHHRCPGPLERRIRRVGVAISGAFAGSVAAALLSTFHVGTLGIRIGAAVGAILAVAIWQALS